MSNTITVDRYKNMTGFGWEYRYEITVPKTNGLNGTSVTLSHNEAVMLQQALASALGLGPGPGA